MNVVEIAASYQLQRDRTASLLLEADPTLTGIALFVAHERFAGDVQHYDFVNHFQQRFAVIAGESLTLIARRHGRIVGSLVNEVVTDEAGRNLLYPKGGYNMIIYQTRIEHSLDFPDEHAIEQPVTGATAALADLLQVTHQHYATGAKTLPPVFCQIQTAMDQALALNEEVHSREMLSLLCSVLEELHVHQQPGISALYAVAQL